MNGDGGDDWSVFAVRMTTNNEENEPFSSLLVGLIPSLLRHLLLRFLSHFFSLVEQLKRGTAAAAAATSSSSSSSPQFFSIILKKAFGVLLKMEKEEEEEEEMMMELGKRAED